MIRTLHASIIAASLLIPAAAVDFVHEVVPILKKHCAECHTAGKHKGGFTMNTREELMQENDDGFVIELGNAEKSLIHQLITTDDEDLRMPPKGKGLNATEVQTIAAWINAGAPWEPGFTFAKKSYEPPLALRRPTLPAPSAANRNHPIDRIIDAHLTKQKTPTPSLIDDAAFARRAYLDIIGLLPTNTQLSTFLAGTAPNKRELLVKYLLANDEGYTGHWMTFWNDLLRNDYAGTGYIDGGRKQISEWLYRSLLENKPYNRFASELIAPSPGSEGFAHGIKWRGEVSAGQTVPIQFAQSVGQTFLGINLKCASCHDSFTDRWKLTDSYGLAAAFSNDKIEIARCDKPTGKIAQPYWLYPELGKIDVTQPAAVRLQQVAKLTTMPQNGRFSRTIVNRLWHRLMGRGIVHPVDAMDFEPWNEALLDYLAIYLVDNGYDLKKTIAHITTSLAYQSHAQVLTTDDETKWKYNGPRAKRMTAEQFVDALWQITGTAPVKPDFTPPSSTPPSAAPRATWIWSTTGENAAPGETIAAKKIINLTAAPELAQAVVTCDNSFIMFINGKEVTRSDDWTIPRALDLKPHLVVGSNEILIHATNAGTGPNAAGLYFQMRIKDAKAEQLISSDTTWQAAPMVNGQADPAAWKPALACSNQGLWDTNPAAIAALTQFSTSSNATKVRASLMKSNLLMRSLGRPNREQIVTSRPNDLTTLEAMDLNNGGILAGILQQGAQHILAKNNGSPQAIVDDLFLQALSRKPSPEELAIVLQTLGDKPDQTAVQDLIWSIIVLPEFQLNR